MRFEPPRIVAVSGPPGSGKSTLARALAQRLGGAPVVSYDDHERITASPPGEIKAWLGRGAPISEIPVPGLREELLRRRSQASAQTPFVVLDTLVGRAHPATEGLVDLMVWIALPLDLALARKVRRVVAAVRTAPGRRDFERLADWLDTYLGHYTDFVHDAYLQQEERIAPEADLSVDGLTAAPILADLVASEIRRRFPQERPNR
ncbi:AAA family ATPase [Methylobacterium sp. J-059]|uniref:AAA family ATPase n=1 Tax=Methylobacterium sp. J-059 TaxID=2836643 RepID=UPI001FB862B5|nr:AAA family ATPase [Methylobacterium sp. J-059]MCJ2038379.1 AAA family ATPase [Methylobacterium sp. J-059]